MNELNRRIKVSLLVVAIFACVVALGTLLTPPVSAASGCWQVQCNTCCKTGHGTVCTQRACP